VLIFSFIILAGAWAVFLRYMPDMKGLPWIDEVLRYLNIWVVFLGASVAVKQGSLLSVDFFLRKLFSAKWAAIIKKLTLVAIAGCLCILIYASVKKKCWDRSTLSSRRPLFRSPFFTSQFRSVLS
jgi:C4-dicarboxylate transporter DctQ subunit